MLMRCDGALIPRPDFWIWASEHGLPLTLGLRGRFLGVVIIRTRVFSSPFAKDVRLHCSVPEGCQRNRLERLPEVLSCVVWVGAKEKKKKGTPRNLLDETIA